MEESNVQNIIPVFETITHKKIKDYLDDDQAKDKAEEVGGKGSHL